MPETCEYDRTSEGTSVAKGLAAIAVLGLDLNWSFSTCIDLLNPTGLSLYSILHLDPLMSVNSLSSFPCSLLHRHHLRHHHHSLILY